MEVAYSYSPFKDDIALQKIERVVILPLIFECQHSQQYLSIALILPITFHN